MRTTWPGWKTSCLGFWRSTGRSTATAWGTTTRRTTAARRPGHPRRPHPRRRRHDGLPDGLSGEKVLPRQCHPKRSVPSSIAKLRELGVADVERETFEASLRAGRRALELLGTRPYEAREAADRFRAHNVAMLEDLLPHLADEAKRLSMARAARAQLEEQFARDREAIEGAPVSWSAEARDATDV